MAKKIRSTTDECLEAMTLSEREEFDRELRKLALSELVLAAMEDDEVSVRKLAKLAGVSPTIVQSMRSGKKDDFNLKSFFKILDSLGFTLLLEKNGEIIPLDISWTSQ
jgi:hypothetical protein